MRKVLGKLSEVLVTIIIVSLFGWGEIVGIYHSFKHCGIAEGCISIFIPPYAWYRSITFPFWLKERTDVISYLNKQIWSEKEKRDYLSSFTPDEKEFFDKIRLKRSANVEINDKEFERLKASLEARRSLAVEQEKETIRKLNTISPPRNVLKLHKSVIKTNGKLIALLEEKGVISATMEFEESDEYKTMTDELFSLVEKYRIGLDSFGFR